MTQQDELSRKAGIAGILAAAGLAVEFGLFVASGWTPETFADPTTALAFLASGSALLRAAGFVEIINLAAALFFLVGLTRSLEEDAPARSTAALYAGLVGFAAHALVPAGLWLGPPTFLELATADPGAAGAAWGGFAAFLDAAGGVGYAFAGAAYAAAGWAILSSSRFPAGAGWVGLLAGGASALTFLAADTVLAPVAAAAFLPALLGAIAFRAWAGLALLRVGPERKPAPRKRTAAMALVVLAAAPAGLTALPLQEQPGSVRASWEVEWQAPVLGTRGYESVNTDSPTTGESEASPAARGSRSCSCCEATNSAGV